MLLSMTLRTLWLLQAASVALIFCLSSPVATAPHFPVDTECDIYSNEEVKKCMNEGYKFTRNLVKRKLDRKPGKKKNFDMCKSYGKFQDCIGPIIAVCPTVKHSLRHHWIPLINEMKVICKIDTDPKERRAVDMECLTAEYDSVLSYQCDSYYAFNNKQKTRHVCHFLHERLHCREALVGSACDVTTGRFLFHLLKLDTEHQLRTNTKEDPHDCNTVHDPKYEGLRYSESCPVDIVKNIDACSNKFLVGDNVVEFREESDIIVTKETRKNLENACRAVRSYNQCLQPIRQGCPHGAKIIFDYAERLKKYLLKMDFICQDHIRPDYSKNLKCMNKKVLDTNKLTQCDPRWQELSDAKQDVTSFQFYCDSKQKNVQDLKSELDKLQNCYSDVFNTECNGTRSTVKQMLQKVFRDPLYLRFEFMPNCELHSAPHTMSDAAGPPGGSEEVIVVSAPGSPSPARGEGAEKPPPSSTTPSPPAEASPDPVSTRKPRRNRDKDRGKDREGREQSTTKERSLPVSSTAGRANYAFMLTITCVLVSLLSNLSPRSWGQR